MILKDKINCSLKFKIFTLLPIFSFLFFQFCLVNAAELKFKWDEPVDEKIGGYYIYWGNESKNYVKRVDLGRVNETSINELAEGNTYYFAVTSYYNEKPDIESDFSNEIVKTIGVSGQQPIPDTGTNSQQPIPDAGTDNLQPVADAGPDQIEPAGTIIVLDGIDSSDPDGVIVSYSWTQLSGPNLNLTNAGSSQAIFTLPAEGVEGQIFSFQLTVKDAEGLQSSDTCNITIAEDMTAIAEATESNYDISGTWGPITSKSNWRKNTQVIFSSFNLTNMGTEDVESVWVTFYKSDDDNFDEFDDHEIVKHEVRNLKVNATADIGLRIEDIKMRSGDRLIAVIDFEEDEGNNISISSAFKKRSRYNLRRNRDRERKTRWTGSRGSQESESRWSGSQNNNSAGWRFSLP